ncbi:hypothetical protein C8R48DRAFT_774731 [Suillus tomentosus]|nr:hypothetical protein C8R48DRAFT_774731 [Suillus tomentosus]
MAPSTRNATRRSATNTGNQVPMVSSSYVMRTRSGVAINPPTKQINKRKRSGILQPSPVPDDPARPKPRPLPRHSSSMSFDDYAQILARPCRQNVNSLAGSVSSIQLQSDGAPDASDTDDDLPAVDSRMDGDHDMDGIGDDDVHDDNGHEDHEYGQSNKDHDGDVEDSVRAKTPLDDVEGDSHNDNDTKDTNEGSKHDKNNEDLECAKTSPARRLWPRKVKAHYNFDDGPQTSSSDNADEDLEHNHDNDHHSLSSPPPKRRKTSSLVKNTSANTSQNATRSTTIHTKHAHMSRSSDNPTPASIVLGPTSDNSASENEEELPGHLKRGQLCQEGIDEAQELGRQTAEKARVIGVKYGKSMRSILIEAGLSIKHSQLETKNISPHFRGVHDANSRVSAIIDWKECQRKHYHVMAKESEQWDTIRNYSITGGNTKQSRAKTILSMREDIARKLSAYSRLEGVEAIGCIFDTTQDEAARQASGFVAGSDFIVKLINKHQLDARAILDWVVTATKAKGYNISVPQFMGGVGAYEILLSKPNKAPATVTEGYGQLWYLRTLFGYRPKAVQWRKLLDYAFQYKFMIKNWPDDVPPIGPDFNPHNLSSQHLKLLVVPFIKRKAHSYYEAELRAEAENLLEIEKKKSKGKHPGRERTMKDVIDELDVNVPEIEFAAWSDECLKQLKDEASEMFDIPLVTSTLDVVLRKLVNSTKFKVSIPEDVLAAHEAHSDAPVPSPQETLPSDNQSPVTLSPPTLPSNQRHARSTTPVHRQEGGDPTRVPDLFDPESCPILPTRREELGSGRRQTNLPFKAKKISRVDPSLAWHMEECPTHSHNDTDFNHEPYPLREDRNFAPPNRHRESSRSPPVRIDTGFDREPYPLRKDRNFAAPNRHHEDSRSPPVHRERDETTRARYYRPAHRQRETSPFADSKDNPHPQHHAYSRQYNQADDYRQRFQVRGTSDSYHEDGPSWFRY